MRPENNIPAVYKAVNMVLYPPIKIEKRLADAIDFTRIAEYTFLKINVLNSLSGRKYHDQI